MTEIFISYKKEDVRRVEPIARALANAGYQVWWDHNIPPGRTYRDVIGAALAEAKCVIVVWSTLSANAQWVLDEADEGKKRNVLLPLLIDNVDIPYGFRQIEAASLVGWSGDTTEPEWKNMLASVAHFVGRAPGGAPKPFATPSTRPPPRPSAAAPPARDERRSSMGPILGVVAVAALAGGGGYYAWQSGMLSGEPEVAAEEEVAEAPADEAVDASAPDQRTPVLVAGDPLQTFFASGYVYCDAKLVAAFWGQDIGETKATIGWKILNDLADVPPQVLVLARNAGHTCDWVDTGYSYADAEQLAHVWELSGPDEAKLQVAQYLTAGQGSVVEQALGR